MLRSCGASATLPGSSSRRFEHRRLQLAAAASFRWAPRSGCARRRPGRRRPAAARGRPGSACPRPPAGGCRPRDTGLAGGWRGRTGGAGRRSRTSIPRHGFCTYSSTSIFCPSRRSMSRYSGGIAGGQNTCRRGGRPAACSAAAIQRRQPLEKRQRRMLPAECRGRPRCGATGPSASAGPGLLGTLAPASSTASPRSQLLQPVRPVGQVLLEQRRRALRQFHPHHRVGLGQVAGQARMRAPPAPASASSRRCARPAAPDRNGDSAGTATSWPICAHSHCARKAEAHIRANPEAVRHRQLDSAPEGRARHQDLDRGERRRRLGQRSLRAAHPAGSRSGWKSGCAA